MPWSAITVSEVLDELSPQEQASFNAIQGQSTTQASILTRVVNEVRGAIRAGGNQLDAEGTVPDQLRNEVIDICVWRWLKKFPALKNLQTEARKDANDEAKKTLKDISRRDADYRVELPASATAEANPAPVNSIRRVSNSRTQLSRRQTSGL